MLTLRSLSTRPKSLEVQFEVECAGKLAAVISLFMIHLSANSLRRIYRLMYWNLKLSKVAELKIN